MNETKMDLADTKEIFMKLGTCSHTLNYVLNREFEHPMETEEAATALLAGGMMNGQQCGMLWGSAMAVGAEAFRRFDDRGQATAAAISATRHVMESFESRTQCVNCKDIVGCNLGTPLGMAIFMVKSLLGGGIKKNKCFGLAADWAPEAVQAAREGLDAAKNDPAQRAMSCASEAARMMGASEEEAVIAAGLAGGMGLSGNACGALGAAIWMDSLAWCRKHPEETSSLFDNREGSKAIIKAFKAETGSEFRCSVITGRRFESAAEHTEFIKSGGCIRLMKVLAAERN